jgi:four helix bundle protein
METNKSYRELHAWQEACKMVKEIYLITKKFPDDERFCMTQQMRRAAISVPANIAEGVGRNHTKDTVQFLYISRGSLYELETYGFIAVDLGYITQSELDQLITITTNTGKILSGFINYNESKLKK